MFSNVISVQTELFKFEILCVISLKVVSYSPEKVGRWVVKLANNGEHIAVKQSNLKIAERALRGIAQFDDGASVTLVEE